MNENVLIFLDLCLCCLVWPALNNQPQSHFGLESRQTKNRQGLRPITWWRWAPEGGGIRVGKGPSFPWPPPLSLCVRHLRRLARAFLAHVQDEEHTEGICLEGLPILQLTLKVLIRVQPKRETLLI